MLRLNEDKVDHKHGARRALGAMAYSCNPYVYSLLQL